MCGWIDANLPDECVEVAFGCAMFKVKRDVCTSVVPKGCLSLGGNFGRGVKASPLQVNV